MWRSSLKWDVKKQTPHVATEAFFSSIGFFGQVWNTDDSHSHNTEMEVLTALPQYLDIQLGQDIPLVAWGGEEGYSLWAHEIQGFKSLLSSSETFGFQLCLLKVSQELPTMLSHLYCFTALFLQLQAIQKLLHGRGEPLNFFSKKICPSSRKTNSIALQGYINWVTESL